MHSPTAAAHLSTMEKMCPGGYFCEQNDTLKMQWLLGCMQRIGLQAALPHVLSSCVWPRQLSVTTECHYSTNETVLYLHCIILAILYGLEPCSYLSLMFCSARAADDTLLKLEHCLFSTL